MKKFLIFIILIFNFNFIFSETINIQNKYNSLNISDKIDYELFEKAYLGYIQIAEKNSNILVIIDYTKPSFEKRFYVIDLEKNELVYNTRVAHSKNSGFEIPVNFSDNPNSFESSLGFFLTLDEYDGAYGHSLRIRGLEENINSNAETRAIVIHGGDIANESYLKTHGFIGRSLGCPVLPTDMYSEIIDYIKGGKVLFINGNDDNYLEQSKYMKLLKK